MSVRHPIWPEGGSPRSAWRSKRNKMRPPGDAPPGGLRAPGFGRMADVSELQGAVPRNPGGSLTAKGTCKDLKDIKRGGRFFLGPWRSWRVANGDSDSAGPKPQTLWPVALSLMAEEQFQALPRVASFASSSGLGGQAAFAAGRSGSRSGERSLRPALTLGSAAFSAILAGMEALLASRKRRGTEGTSRASSSDRAIPSSFCAVRISPFDPGPGALVAELLLHLSERTVWRRTSGVRHVAEAAALAASVCPGAGAANFTAPRCQGLHGLDELRTCRRTSL
jgi:hypothetical protein